MIREELRITVTPLPDGAAVRIPKDAALIKRFRRRFRKAIWGPGTQSWHVPGKLAAKRAEQWASDELPYLWQLEHRARDVEWEAAAQPPTRIDTERGKVWASVYTRYAATGTHPMPEGEIERVDAALQALSRELSNETLFGFMSRRVSLYRYWPPSIFATEPGHRPPAPMIEMFVGPDLLRTGGDIEWRWSDIHRCGDRIVSGWLPDFDFHAITSTSIKDRIWSAMNPGKKRYL